MAFSRYDPLSPKTPSELSINALAERWTHWFENLPEYSDLTEEKKIEVAEMLELQERQRQKNINNL